MTLKGWGLVSNWTLQSLLDGLFDGKTECPWCWSAYLLLGLLLF